MFAKIKKKHLHEQKCISKPILHFIFVEVSILYFIFGFADAFADAFLFKKMRISLYGKMNQDKTPIIPLTLTCV